MTGWGEVTEGVGCGTRLILILGMIGICLLAIPFLIAIAVLIAFFLPFFLILL